MESSKYSSEPCDKCGKKTVRASLEDESSGDGTYYDIVCDTCHYRYKVDGPDY